MEAAATRDGGGLGKSSCWRR